MKNNFFILLILLSVVAKAQVGSISFNVYDEFSKKPVSASVIVLATSDTIKGSGNIEVSNVMAGDQSFKIISSGYDVVDLNDISIIPNQNITYSVGLTKSARTIDEVRWSSNQAVTNLRQRVHYRLEPLLVRKCRKMRALIEMYQKRFYLFQGWEIPPLLEMICL